MADKIACTITVNGEAHDALVRADETLLDVLRDRFALTGTKRGCNHGVCGACNVLIDGVLSRSCLTLAVEVDERTVTTVEGVSEDARLSEVQRALVEAGAIQCGFCTPGFVMALAWLFSGTERPSHEAIRTAVSGNLCRCSGYVKIVQAAVRLADTGFKVKAMPA